jgi:hypothetical protein
VGPASCRSIFFPLTGKMPVLLSAAFSILISFGGMDDH